MAQGKSFDRYSSRSLAKGASPDPKGRVFIAKRICVDLSHILICLASVDTVRQLYFGRLKADVLERLKEACENNTFFELSPGWFCSVGRLGKNSGYRYRVQDNETGIILLVASYYAMEDEDGNHLKIELSPHFLAARGVKQVQAQLNILAHRFLSTCEPTGCAVHLALDVQGWQPGQSFEDNFRTRSRAVRPFDGISNLEFDGLSEVVASYGKGARQSIMFGKPNSLQAVIYDKSREIEVSDKVDYFHQQWGVYTMGEFDPSQPVSRIEMRVHHNVMREIAEGQGEQWKTFEHVSQYLTDIWRYCLNTQRLDYSSVYIDPVWQLFRDDPEFIHPANGLLMRRKKKEDQSAIGRNYGIIIGNLVTVLTRQGFNAEMIMYELKKLRMYKDMLEYYANVRKISEAELKERIRNAVIKRKTTGKAAGFALAGPAYDYGVNHASG
jgi:hypothetical protein